jgi:hypothetical protein
MKTTASPDVRARRNDDLYRSNSSATASTDSGPGKQPGPNQVGAVVPPGKNTAFNSELNNSNARKIPSWIFDFMPFSFSNCDG